MVEDEGVDLLGGLAAHGGKRTAEEQQANVQLGVLNPLRSGQGLQNPDFAAAYCRAINDWQIAEWTSKDARLKASVCLPYEDAVALKLPTLNI